MPRFLVIANQTLGGGALERAIAYRLKEGLPYSFHVVVPATEGTGDGAPEVVAKERLEECCERFRRLGAEVSGEVGDADPMGAIEAAMEAGGFDGMILSTLPAGISRWLNLDLPSRLERRYDIPIIHIEAEADG